MGRLRSFALLSSPVLAVASFAQTATTSLRGVVQDRTGAVIPGASLTLLNAASGQTLTVTSNQQGEYQLPQIAPARYSITATATGFGSQKKEAELLVNQPATISFTLGAASSGVVIEVTDTAQSLNNTDATLGSAFDNATIQALPSETRNVPDLLALQPGVFYLQPPQNLALQDSRSGAVNGERSDQSNVTLDGVDDNDQLRGLAFFGVLRETQDSVEEFRVVTSNANADEGRSSGAQVSMVTKSGTNKYHGAAYEYNRPTNTVSNDYFNKQSQLASNLENRPPKLIRNIFGGDVGGFAKRDQLFFFGNYEGQRLAESQVVVRTAPTALYQQGTLNYQYDDARRYGQHHPRSARDAGCRLQRVQHDPIPLRARRKPKCFEVSAVLACGQRVHHGRRREHGVVYLFIPGAADAEHEHRAPGLYAREQAPDLWPRELAEGHAGLRAAVSWTAGVGFADR